MLIPKPYEGEVDFQPHKDGPTYQTWYKVYGDLNSGRSPLVILHGGPGACHDYLLPFTDLSTHYGIPVVFYDQLGNGHSTHLREKKCDTSFWTERLFLDELANLTHHLKLNQRGYDLYGQSWGGMLGATHASSQPQGLRRLIIANSPASIKLWVEGVTELKKKLPEDVQEVIERCEREEDYKSKEYEQAMMVFYERHVSLARPFPCPEAQVTLERLTEDATVYGLLPRRCCQGLTIV